MGGLNVVGTTRSLAERLVKWLAREIDEAGASGALVGLSGGLDSATVAMLLTRAVPGRGMGLLMPCHSDPRDLSDGELAGQAAGLPAATVELSGAFDALMRALDREGAAPPVARANVKPRLRMNALYFEAARRNYLVIGTGNRTELELGYFTKYGDGGVDLLPLGGLWKTEVRQLAKELGVPAAIIERVPSAGLWAGQTDEGEMGLTYEEADRYLATGEGSEKVSARVEELRRRGSHKLRMPPIFVP